MPIIVFLHTPTRVTQTGRVSYVHYHCSVTSTEAGTAHHHALLPRIHDEGNASRLPTPDDPQAWTLTADAWAAYFAEQGFLLFLPGQQIAVLSKPMATPRRRATVKSR